MMFVACLSPAPEHPVTKALTAAAPPVLPRDVRVVIWKSQYTLTLYDGERPLKTYRAVFGRGFRDGDKERAGDRRTPEGTFFICTMRPSERFYKFMGLSYPDPGHAELGLQNGLITQRQYQQIRKAHDERQQPPWDTRLGGAVGIHGRVLASAVGAAKGPAANWTDGCIALENADIDEIYRFVSLGTPVTILP